jgi:eukaryotic-like serine/threonine-protein kinase
MTYPNLGVQYHFFEPPFASGGTGEIFRALDRNKGEIVAVKRLFDTIKDPDIIRKFKIEANIYLMLNHKNIVSLKDFKEVNGEHFLIMEYIQGHPLNEFIDTVTGPIPLSVTKKIMVQILDAIHYAHTKHVPIDGYLGVLHLDLKPSNILISNNHLVKVIDYGISQGSDEERVKKIIGTPMYMAPEQFDVDQDLTDKTDIYSLGLVLHQMITATFPYKENVASMKELRDRILSTETDRIIDSYKYANIKVQDVIDRATSKSPYDRYDSCLDMKYDLLNIE